MFLILLLLSTSFGFFLLRRNTRSNIRDIGTEEAGVVSLLFDDTLSVARSIAQQLSLASDLRIFCRQHGSYSASERILHSFHLLTRFRDSILPKQYLHSICIVAGDGESYHWSNGMSTSFLPYFEDRALHGGRIDDFIGFSEIYSYGPTTGNRVPVDMVSFVCDVVDLEGKNYPRIGKIIININYGEMIQNLKNGTGFFDDIGIYYAQEGRLFLQSSDASETISAADIRLDRTFTETRDSFLYKIDSLDSDIKLILTKDKDTILQFADLSTLAFYVLLVALTYVVFLLFVFPLFSSVTREIDTLNTGFEKVGKADYSARVALHGSEELQNISRGFNKMVARVEENTALMLRQQKQEEELKFELLLARINPHFIYNTLNSIIYLARRSDNQAVMKVTSAFITLLQDSIQLDESTIFTDVKSEIDLVRKYITIQEYRYKGIASFQIECDDEESRFKIPKNIITPLIENALIHGVCESEGTGLIKLSLRHRDDGIEIVVEDDGMGMSEERLEEVKRHNETQRGMHSIGISNIYGRLKFLYDDRFVFEITSKMNEGTRICIIIPA